MDKLMTESAENFISAGKSRLSDSSINVPQEDKISAPAPEVEADELETRLDISSELIAESIPNSASKVSVSSPSQLSDGFQAEYQPSKIVLIGTAHVSEKSVAEVKDAIRNLKPDIVAVELCRGRYDALKGNVQEKQVPIKEILTEGKVYYYIIHWLLAYVQKKIGDDMGVNPEPRCFLQSKKLKLSGLKLL